MARASIIGAGMTPFGVHERPLPELFSDAAMSAMDDAGVQPDELDALYLGNALSGLTENDTHLAPTIGTHIGLTGVPCQRFEDACASSSNAFKHAVQALELGIHDTVLVGGVEKCSQSTGVETPEMTRYFGSGVHKQYEQPAGLTAPALFGLLTKRYMREYGLTESELAEVAVKNHYHGSLNDRAHFGRDTTVDEILDSPVIADPFRLMDCCPFSDGASALVLTKPTAAPDYRGMAVDVTGIGHATDAAPIAEKEQPLATLATQNAAAEAYGQAGLEASDLDVAEVHDCFTGAEILAIEALGLAKRGHGGEITAAGETYIDGEVPVNPSGGLKAKGHPIGATGTAQLVELTEQLRGDAGDRQVNDARTAVAQNLGGDAATTVVTTLEVSS